MRKLPAAGAHWDLLELRPGRCWIAVARLEARHCAVKCFLLQAAATCVAIQVDAAAVSAAPSVALAIYAAPFLATPTPRQCWRRQSRDAAFNL